eukprot:9475485-Pyramimonas_sp.AAC.1
MFSGTGQTARVLRDAYGASAYTFERDDHATEDGCTVAGMLYALWVVGAVVPGGCILLSPQCSTWLNLTCYHTRTGSPKSSQHRHPSASYPPPGWHEHGG